MGGWFQKRTTVQDEVGGHVLCAVMDYELE